MEPSRASLPVLRRRRALRLFAAAPAVAVLAACGGEPEEPDQLLPLATAAKADAALANAIARTHSGLAETARELAAARTAHAKALQREIDRVAPRDPEDPPSVPDPAPRKAPPSANAAADALRTAVRRGQQQSAELVARLPAHRAGLVASVSAGCASLLEVLG
ncbi:hypothetical protein EIL87_13880 [Saccharopolyspora rhizosphaerae]|uniref:Uncharacterized protein n=1 Tax=Saccharopolyspora rhizosphaerae TaxID=2492662 RepID=A0A3R8P4H2_9PSEU|nr:hypothetical protein [Saccharopolyspora rhizosphaerae]RRO16142.1 hypothetical protein EIL87_13880 [Saccharopolyspora rhizosphaerae]